jgi:phosphoglucomutase
VRPSGTEPKCKIYFGVRRETGEEAEVALSGLVDDVMGKLEISTIQM